MLILLVVFLEFDRCASNVISREKNLSNGCVQFNLKEIAYCRPLK